MKITASCWLAKRRIENIPVLNPGDWFGRTWLIEIGGSFDPLFLIVEADTVQDAIDELADSEEFSHHIVVEDEDLGDYPEDNRTYAGNSGKVVDLDWVHIHGSDNYKNEGLKSPFPCTYHGEGLPEGGIKAIDFDWDDVE